MLKIGTLQNHPHMTRSTNSLPRPIHFLRRFVFPPNSSSYEFAAKQLPELSALRFRDRAGKEGEGMWGLEIDVGSKQLGWLSSVLAGILMCKVVYDLTGVISALSVKEYRRLNRKQKLEWNNRGFSTFHAIVAAATALYLLLFSDLFYDSRDQLMINRSSSLSNTIMGVSIGYFLSDLAMILYHYPALGGVEYVIHHGLSMFSIVQSLFSGQAQIYILMVLFTESTTPFVNLRWYLEVAGLKNSKLYVYNGVALFLGWLVARIILFVFFFCHMYIHFDQVKLVFPLGFYSLLTVSPALMMMNVFWFWKIARGMVKTLSKARHSQ